MSLKNTVLVPNASVIVRGVLKDGWGTNTCENTGPDTFAGLRYENVPTALNPIGWHVTSFPTPANGGKLGPVGSVALNERTLKLCCPNAVNTDSVKRLSH